MKCHYGNTIEINRPCVWCRASSTEPCRGAQVAEQQKRLALQCQDMRTLDPNRQTFDTNKYLCSKGAW